MSIFEEKKAAKQLFLLEFDETHDLVIILSDCISRLIIWSIAMNELESPPFISCCCCPSGEVFRRNLVNSVPGDVIQRSQLPFSMEVLSILDLFFFIADTNLINCSHDCCIHCIPYYLYAPL